MRKIYCAGPLFNPMEREEMGQIANALEESGYGVFLPQRDGLELSQLSRRLADEGMPDERASSFLSKAIFMVDTYQVAHSDGLLLNLNGRVPDEGAMVEAGIAWALQKPIVIYKNDSRTPFSGVDNPIVLGLTAFKTVARTGDVPREFDRLFATQSIQSWFDIEAPNFRSLKRGQKVQRILKEYSVNRTNAERLAKVLQD